MSFWQAYINDIVFTFRKHKAMAEQAFLQLTAEEDFFRNPGQHSNSVAIIIKHLAGNLTARWTDFLNSDGEKPGRDRDAEFVIGPEETRTHLLAAWEHGWSALFQTLCSLQECDLLRNISIRGEVHTVLQAIQRSMAHAAYHVGQIVYLARLLKTDGWKWITIAPGQSKEHAAQGGKYLMLPSD